MKTIEILRSYRLFEIAIFDVIMTILGGYLFAKYIIPYFNSKIEINRSIYVKTIIGMFILGIIVHYVFNIPTMLNYYLGISERPMRK